MSAANDRGHFEPAVYDGPSVSVLSSDISSSQFSATLRLSNATTWIGGGELNIDSSDAGVIWALGSSPPNDPSDPSSDFQQHKIMGIFSVNMKSAQVDQGASPTQSGSTTQSTDSPNLTGLPAPSITGDITPHARIGLTHRDKVRKLEMLLIVGDYCSWYDYGSFFCDFIPSWRNHYSFPRSISSRSNKIALY